MSARESDMNDTQGVVIEKLPTIGEAYTLKTIKQGRQVSVSDVLHCRTDALVIKTNGMSSNVVGYRNHRKVDTTVLVHNAKRILKFDKATPSQKMTAERLLKIIEAGGKDFFNYPKTIQGIVRTLGKKYREF